MLGAIVGDIVGSVYEWNNIKMKDFPLFRKDCFFTDDTVMTCAVAEAIMKTKPPIVGVPAFAWCCLTSSCICWPVICAFL